MNADERRAAREKRQIYIVFDGPPGPQAGRFVEVNDYEGKSIRIGEWVDMEDGYWWLSIDDPRDLPAALDELDAKDAEIERLRGALREDVAECAAWCDVDKGCSVCHRLDTCKKRAALEGREG